MNGGNKVLLWIGAGIGISVAAAWAMTQQHGHDNLVSQPELNRVYDRLGEIQDDIKELLNKVGQLRGDHSGNSDN